METSLSLSALGEWENGIIDIGPELVLAIQKHTSLNYEAYI